MEKQKVKIFGIAEQRRTAKLWDAARRLMTERQFGVPINQHNRLGALIHFSNAVKILDAAVGTGVNFDLSNDASLDVSFSDGSSSMLAVLREKAEGKSPEKIHLVAWHELPRIFGREIFDLVMILGNSLPYATSWNGQTPSVDDRMKTLEISLKAVFDVLKSTGKFLFDLARYGKGRMEIGRAEIDGKEVTIFFDVKYEEGRRFWTIGTENESYTLNGLALNLEMLTQMLKSVGFAQIDHVPDNLQPDPLFYDAYIAHK